MSRNVERTAYELALHAWAESVVPSGWDVIFADADGARPKAKYVLLNVIAFSMVGHGENRVLDQVFGDECLGELQHHYEGTCSVAVFGSSARTVVETLRRSIDLPSVQESTGDDDLSLVGSSDSLNQTELEGTRSVPRFQTDVFFHWSDVTYYEAEVIETVTMTRT